ncbi:MAG: ABC transporter ATP-binding protein, partial [Clostridia bacterium]|nr:ABC transporter ATP-binding protein [Clostridia bacterium]
MNRRIPEGTGSGRRGERMGGMRGMRGPVEKPQDFKGAVKNLLKYLGVYKIAIIIVMILAVFSTVFAILGPKILGDATTVIYSGIMAKMAGASEGIDFKAVGRILILLAALYIFSALLQLAQGFIMAGISNKISYELRRDIAGKIHRLPFSYYDGVSKGDVLSRITNDVDVINQSLNQGITQIITSAATILGILVMMFSISWQMAFTALIILPISMLVLGLIIKRSQKHFVNQQEYLGRVNGLVEENYGSHDVVKAFNAQERSLDQFSESNDFLYESAWKANFLSGLMMPIMNVVGNIGFVIICIMGGYFAVTGRITVGNIQSFVQYMRQFTHPIARLSQISNVLQQTAASAERVFNFLEEDEKPTEAEGALGIRKEGDMGNKTGVEVTGEVKFENISFGYEPDKPVIRDFNAHIKPGQKVAIVGPTGAGKTTIVKLLMRFYDVDEGRITLDGRDIRDFKRDDLRNLFGMVLQETWLFSGTISDNIRYGMMDATEDELMAAMKLAQADHFISTLPQGGNALLNEEASNLSLGQKQLLTIARAVLHDPKILIFDEATSSVDTRTELL